MTESQPAKQEQINLEYMVSFEDGLRPRLYVYGIDHKAGEVYGASVHIGISVGACINVSMHSEEEQKEKNISVGIGTNLGFSSAVKKDRRLPKTEDWEQKMYDEGRERGWNIIKVQNPEHIRPAIDIHSERYIEQFRPLEEKFMRMFFEFLNEHPGYNFPNFVDGVRREIQGE